MENHLKAFIIKKFVIVLLCVGFVEAVINFVNINYIFPFYKEIFGIDIGRSNIKISGTELLLLITIILLQILIRTIGGMVPGVLDTGVDELVNQLTIFMRRTIPSLQTANIISGSSKSETIFALMVIISIIFVLILPYILGALFFSRAVVKEFTKLEEERDAQKKEYDRKRNLMLSDIAHDLRTPITTVAGYAKALSDGMVNDEAKKQEYLLAMQTKSSRMNDLINLLFDYVKLDSEGFVLDKEELDLCELLRENAALIYSDMEENGFEFEIEIPEKQFFIMADRLQLSRVITNLLTNVMRHNNSGTKVLLQMQIDKPKDSFDDNIYAVIKVADSGSDISAEIEESIFEPFAKADKSRSNSTGSGLGLSIVKKIVDKHGYKISINHDVKPYTKAFEIRVANMAK